MGCKVVAQAWRATLCRRLNLGGDEAPPSRDIKAQPLASWQRFRFDAPLVVMTVQELRNAQRRSPFYPYRIRMADGHEYRVPQPDYLALSPTERLAYVFDEEGNSHR